MEFAATILAFTKTRSLMKCGCMRSGPVPMPATAPADSLSCLLCARGKGAIPKRGDDDYDSGEGGGRA